MRAGSYATSMNLRHVLLLAVVCPTLSLGAQSSDPVATKPSLGPEAQTAFIEEVRLKALHYSKNLPDFLCTQIARRYSASAQTGRDPSWKLLDTLAMHLTYFGQ